MGVLGHCHFNCGCCDHTADAGVYCNSCAAAIMPGL